MAFVVSEGRLLSIDRPKLSSRPQAVQIAPRVSQEYATIWRTQPQVRTVVGFLARNIAQLGLKVYRRRSDVDREQLRDHPLAILLANPGPHCTRYRLVDALVQDLGIYDNAYWLKVRESDQARALVRLDPRRVTPQGPNAFYADEFEYRGGVGIQHFPADQVVHFRGFNPEDPRIGSSPIETLRTILAEEYQAAQYREQMWRNGARASGYLRRPVEAPEWSREARERFTMQWRNQYSGDGALTGGTPILEDGMEFVSASVTPEQAQYLEARKLTREEVAAAYFVPPPMVGILDNATYSNITEQHKMMYQDTLGPWLQMMSQEIDLQLLGDFDDVDQVYTEFNLNEKLRGSFEQQAAQLQTAVGAPYMTRNEARAVLNMPQLPEGDDLVTPLNVLIGGQASPTDSAPPPPDPTGQAATPAALAKARVGSEYTGRAKTTMSGYFARQGQVISSRVGAVAGTPTLADVYDGKRWVAELTTDLFSLAVQIATAAGKATLRALGLDPKSYDEDRTLAFLQAHAAGAAEGIESATRDGLKNALTEDDPGKAIATLFAQFATGRADKIAETEATAMSGFGTAEAAEKSGHEATKTWRTHSKNSRASHVALDGETVALDKTFSNGGRWPGDLELPPDERDGCQCSMDIALAE
jgi:HK97 family phage portal protein